MKGWAEFNEPKTWQEAIMFTETDLASALFPDRPYVGQPHTSTGERGKTLVARLTFRDVRDCFVIGAYRASGVEEKDYPKDIFDLPWGDMDPLAVWQNMACEMEKRMDIYPNVPLLEPVVK